MVTLKNLSVRLCLFGEAGASSVGDTAASVGRTAASSGEANEAAEAGKASAEKAAAGATVGENASVLSDFTDSIAEAADWSAPENESGSAPGPASENASEGADDGFADITSDSSARLKQLESIEARRALTERIMRRGAEKRYRSMLREAQELEARVPGFELRRELSDKRFIAMLRGGLSMEEAFCAAHMESIISAAGDAAAQKAASGALDALRASSSRPDENGAGGQSGIAAGMGVDSLSGRGIRDILARVEKGVRVRF